MPAFALITEGITDQAVIECILCGLFGNDEDFAVNPLQPLRDATDETRSVGQAGWEKVLEYCETDQVADGLSFNDFVVIQIDTDQGDHPNFGVPLTHQGSDRDTIDLVEDTIRKIESLLGDAVCDEFADRIIYAIAVHATECWLYAHHAASNVSARTKNCYSHLERLIKRKRLRICKEYDCYRDLAKPLFSKKNLYAAAKRSESLQHFICALCIVRQID